MDKETLDYYQKQSSAYRTKAFAIDMGFLQRKFMALLPPGAKILDLGCGPGRDLAVFSRSGFRTIGLDRSEEMIALARDFCPSTLLSGDMIDIRLPKSSVDGVWCCASLLHVAREDAFCCVAEMMRIARPGAVILISVKKGKGYCRSEDGRLFTLFEEAELLAMFAKCEIEQYTLNTNEDARGQQWISIIGRKPFKGGKTRVVATVRNALTWGRYLLQDLYLESEQLLQHVLSIEKTAIYTCPDRRLTAEQDLRYFSLLRRRKDHEPLAYLTGRRGFMSLEFSVSSAVLIPRPETELLVEHLIERFQEKSAMGLDLGTGSGCIAISLLKYLPGTQMIAVDISPDALWIAKKNAIEHEVNKRLQLFCGNLFAPLGNLVFDFIVSNPPYVSERDYRSLMPEVKREPTLALLAGDGLDFYRRILNDAPDYLSPGGILLLELGYGQLADVQSLVPDSLALGEVICDYAGIERGLCLTRK